MIKGGEILCQIDRDAGGPVNRADLNMVTSQAVGTPEIGTDNKWLYGAQCWSTIVFAKQELSLFGRDCLVIQFILGKPGQN